MTNQKESYLEKKTGTMVSNDGDHVTFSLHRTKIKLHDELEVHLLKAIDPQVLREFNLTEDLLDIICFPPSSYLRFDAIQKKNKQARWRAAYNVLQQIEHHSQRRLNLIICPENVMFDQGLIPHILYYGVKESIPPYEDDKEQLWLETRAILTALIDDTHDFETYLAHYERIKISKIAKQIMHADSHAELYQLIESKLQEQETYEQTLIPVPKKKWKVSKFVKWGLIILLIPAVIFTLFSLFFKTPELESYVASNHSFLQNHYSDVIETLDDYDYKKMPYVVQYQLATAYLAYETLEETQKKNIENTITLQSDDRYFMYWIGIGRGDYEEAIDTARALESRDLIVYGLLKNREAVKADQSLEGEEREGKIKEIDQEIEGYQKEMEEERKAEEEMKEEAEKAWSMPKPEEETEESQQEEGAVDKNQEAPDKKEETKDKKSDDTKTTKDKKDSTDNN